MEYPSREYNYSPTEKYPEYPWPEDAYAPTIPKGGKNEVYALVRQGFIDMGLDKEHYGTADWNPLGEYLKPGQTVHIKPNWVENKNKNKDVHDNLACLVTHPSVVRAVLDYVFIALKGSGRILLADAPMQQCNLQEMFSIAGYDELFEFLEGKTPKVEIYDLRKYSITAIRRGVFTAPKMTENSPGSEVVTLDGLSVHAENDKDNPVYKVSEYKKEDTASYHNGHKHTYEISRVPLMADVIINMPKPKTHRLAGMTAAIKNMVGITYEKASLPHRKQGSKEEGGDTYQKQSFWKTQMQRFDEKKTIASTSGKSGWATWWDFLMKVCYMLGWLTTGDKYRIGSWYGNDTIWRTSIDLNYILLHADEKGVLHLEVQRPVLTIADMIVSGQGAGPVGPHPKALGLVMIADNSLLFDRIMLEIMGFEKRKIAMFSNPLSYKRLGYDTEAQMENETILQNGSTIRVNEFKAKKEWAFDAHPMWKGHIEK